MPEEVATSADTSQSVGTQSDGVPQSSSSAYVQKIGESRATGNGASVADADSGQRPESKPKELSRYERTKRQKAILAQREAAIRYKEAEFAQRERAQTEKPKRDYTLGDLQKYRRQWEQEGNFELVEAADKEMAVIQAEEAASKRTVQLPNAGTPEHRAQWEAAEQELAQTDPEFMREGTRLDRALREIMSGPDGDIYRQHPRGIVAAYHRAKMELLEADLKVSQTENSKLKDELKKYQGLTSIGGGAPARVSGGARVENLADFEKLSTKEMRKHLMATSRREGVPWF